MDWKDLKVKIEQAFEDVDKDLWLCKYIVKLLQICIIAKYMKYFYAIVLELGYNAPND